MITKSLLLKDLKDTEVFGQCLGSLLRPGDILCLNGELGAGKTTVTQAIARGMGIDEYVTSPTFAIVNEYRGSTNMYHFDTYRLEHLEELDDLGLDEYFYSEHVSVIEWAERIAAWLPEERLEVRFSKPEDDEGRQVELRAFGKHYEQMISELNL